MSKINGFGADRIHPPTDEEFEINPAKIEQVENFWLEAVNITGSDGDFVSVAVLYASYKQLNQNDVLGLMSYPVFKTILQSCVKYFGLKVEKRPMDVVLGIELID